MKAKRKSDGKQIEVRGWRGASDVVYSTLDMNEFYQESELDFNVDMEGTVISGWVARASDGHLALFKRKPDREVYMRSNNGLWFGRSMTELDANSFPDLTWESDPIEVEIIIKRKKN